MDRQLKEKFLKNQTFLNINIMELTEADIVELIKAEQVGRARINYLKRCYSRFSILRKKREKGALIAGSLHIKLEKPSKEELDAYNAMIQEQEGKCRSRELTKLYGSFYDARRGKEEEMLEGFKF